MTDYWPREGLAHTLTPPKGYDPYWWIPLDRPIVEVQGRPSGEGPYLLTVSQCYLNRKDPPWPHFEVLPRWLCRLLRFR